MVSESAIRYGVGIIGNVISFGLFLAPLPTYKRIWTKKSTEEFHPWPYLATTMNCIFWILYGIPIVHLDSILVVTINSIGLVLEIIYLSVFFYFTTYKNRKIIFSVLLAEIALLVVIAVVTLLCFHTHTARSAFVGVVCVIFGIIMYFSPLSIILKVYATKSSEFLPFWLCLAGFLNGVCWFSYAFLKKFDPYLATANGMGALFGCFQLLVYAYYTVRGKKSTAVEDGAKPGEVQLQKHNRAPPA